MSKETLLLQRARLFGDRRALTGLVRIHQGRVRAFLLRLTQRVDLADDLAQDTFIQAFKKLEDYAGTGSFSSWLMQIAYFNFLQARRSENRRVEIAGAYQQNRIALGRQFEQISSDQIDLENALARLRREERAAISLCYSYGLTHEEAAGAMSLPVGTIKTHIRRGKAKLRRFLDAGRLHGDVL